ncbi:hypothetical protein, partial [Streptomyces niveiscabiei]|uniref:hypothetical protein n=1 Tax=Streptomyces niveiscabiei TaxID=164115 RepID=UPI0038F6B75A
TELTSHPNARHYQQVLAHLTKPALLALLAPFDAQLSIKKSATKAQLVAQACDFFANKLEYLTPVYNQFIINNRADIYEYFEFLYIGLLSSG